jgi:hypothetical protein
VRVGISALEELNDLLSAIVFLRFGFSHCVRSPTVREGALN